MKESLNFQKRKKKNYKGKKIKYKFHKIFQYLIILI